MLKDKKANILLIILLLTISLTACSNSNDDIENNTTDINYYCSNDYYVLIDNYCYGNKIDSNNPKQCTDRGYYFVEGKYKGCFQEKVPALKITN